MKAHPVYSARTAGIFGVNAMNAAQDLRRTMNAALLSAAKCLAGEEVVLCAMFALSDIFHRKQFAAWPKVDLRKIFAYFRPAI